jgi:hypothetical protein
LTFEIEKGRLSFQLTSPYSEDRKRRQVSGRRCMELAKNDEQWWRWLKNSHYFRIICMKICRGGCTK